MREGSEGKALFFQDTYYVFNEPDGVFDAKTVLLTTLTDSTYSHGQVGLYDFYPATSFSNFSVTGDVTVLEPSTWAMIDLGFAGLDFVAYLRKSKLVLMAA